MAFERLVARKARQEEQIRQLESILGQPCKATWTFKDPGGGDYWVAHWKQTFSSPVVARGNLRLPTGTRMFEMVCNGAIAVIHPKDAGWVVRAVERYMTVKPIWAKASSTRTLPGGLTVPAGAFPWIPKQWTCPECYPRPDGSCIDDCTPRARFGGRMDGRVALYGYDNRFMRPWSVDVDVIPECSGAGAGGENTLCMPVEDACGVLVRARDYFQVFWQDVAKAITKYNENPPARETTPQPAKVAMPKRDVNWLPLLAFGLGTGLLSVFLRNLRH